MFFALCSLQVHRLCSVLVRIVILSAALVVVDFDERNITATTATLAATTVRLPTANQLNYPAALDRESWNSGVSNAAADGERGFGEGGDGVTVTEGKETAI